jgi:hypothetical protein
MISADKRALASMKLLTITVAAVLLGMTLVGCGASATGSAGGSRNPHARVDPQVLSDVAAGAFPLPGPSELRTIRVTLASIGLPNAACGGENVRDVDDTSLRFDQARYADLELIATKGLTEREMPQPARASPSCRTKKLPSFGQWSALAAPWQDATLTAANAPSVVATHARNAECLRRASGLKVDDGDPTASYLNAVDYLLSGLSSSVLSARYQRKFSRVYARCTRSYFAALAAQLTPVKRRLVERNRELLERYAAELAALGYVP